MLYCTDTGASLSALDYLGALGRVLPLVPQEPLRQAIDLILETRAAGRRLYIVGNGGSAATASHLVCDLAKTAAVEGFAPVRAFALADNTSLMTAWANDLAFEATFAQQLTGLVEPDDVVIAISASGNSPNIVAALESAERAGARTIALVGFDGGAARDLADIAVHVPCHNYGLVEDTHAAIAHAITAAVRAALVA